MLSKPTDTSFDMPRVPRRSRSALHRDLNAFGWYAHRRSHHLTGDLRASRQSPKQKVAGTRAGTAASDSLVGLGMIDGTPDIDRACHRSIRLCPPFARIVICEARGHCDIALSGAFEGIEYPWQPHFLVSPGLFSPPGKKPGRVEAAPPAC